MNDVTHLPRRAMPGGMEGLRELIAEYTAASSAERNYGSCRFAHLFWSFLTEAMPVIEQQHADASAQRKAQIAAILAEASGRAPRAVLKAVK